MGTTEIDSGTESAARRSAELLRKPQASVSQPATYPGATTKKLNTTKAFSVVPRSAKIPRLDMRLHCNVFAGVVRTVRAIQAKAVLTRASPRYGSRVNGRHEKNLV